MARKLFIDKYDIGVILGSAMAIVVGLDWTFPATYLLFASIMNALLRRK